MNNLSSYSGLVDAKIGASDKDLPVLGTKLLFKNKIKSPCELTLAAAIMMKGRKYISSRTKKSFQRWPT